MPKRPLRTTRKVSNLQGQPGWYRIVNSVAGGPAQVTIYDEIGMLGTAADTFIRDLAGLQGDIELHLNSPGGDVFDGIAIYNTLRQRQGTVTVVVDGLAASAASFIAQAASPGHLAMAPHSQMMIHDGFGMSIGNAADMRDMADLLDKASDNIARIYAGRTGQPAEHWRALMQAETWLDDHEAVAAGLADYVQGQDRPANSWDLSVYDRPRNADASPVHNGHPRVDPDGDGDCDACPEGDTDHDYWNPEGEQIQPIPGAVTGRAAQVLNEKYSADDRKQMAGNEAMDDGSYPVKDEEDLHNAIRAVGRGGADHDAIRRHIIKRAAALGASSAIPDNWNSDGSMKAAGNLSAAEIFALFEGELSSSDAGKE